jgi:hypothetical protein
VEKKIGGIAIDRVKFTALHPALKRHLVRSALQQYLGDLSPYISRISLRPCPGRWGRGSLCRAV